MGKWMQEIIDKENEEREKEVTLRIAKNMLERKYDVSEIANCTSLPVEKIAELKRVLSPSA